MLTVVATVEQTYWEVVFANENLKVAEAALKAAQELLATNRAKAKAGVMSIVDVLQAEAAVASRVEQVLVAEKSIRDQEDLLRRLLNPGEDELRQDVRLTPKDRLSLWSRSVCPKPSIWPSTFARRSSRRRKTGDQRTQYQVRQEPTASYPLVPGHDGSGRTRKGLYRFCQSQFQRDFYNYGAGLVLSYPSATARHGARSTDGRSRQERGGVVGEHQATDHHRRERSRPPGPDRLQTNRNDQVSAHYGGEAAASRARTSEVGLSTTRFVLDFQRDLATAQGNELRAIVDYNKSLSNLSAIKPPRWAYSLQVQ